MKKLLLIAAILFSAFRFEPGDGKPESGLDNLNLLPKSDVVLQGFYWESPPGGMWFDSLKALAARIASAGFGAIWIPPAAKGGGGLSMGYDIYDHYDLGEFNQKGSIETRFGSRAELDAMVDVYKSVGVELIFDAVMNHVGNGDSQAPYQCGGGLGWIVMNPASGRFSKGPANFHSNNVHCDFNSPYHNKIFFEDLCYFSGGTGDSLIAWGNFLLNELGFDGFRLDAVKHIEPLFIAQFSQAFPGVYMVGEHWSSVGEILNYYNQVVSYGGNISLFDYPLRYTLQSMCNNTSGSYDMNGLDNAGLVNAGMSGFNVATFAENHDLDRIGWDGTVHPGHDPILTDKEMAYAYLIFSEGRPYVFFKDYVDYGFGSKIDTLIWIRQTFIYGGTTKRSQLNPWYVGGSGTQEEQSRDIYVARRNGGNGKPQVYLVLNDNANEWRGVWVNTDYPNQVFRDYTGHGMDKLSAGDGRVDLWAPPRGYAIYVPDTTQFINHPPVMENIPDQVAYTNSIFKYQVNVFDADGDLLTYQISGNPSWLGLSKSGLLSGIPAFADTGSSTIIVQVSDPFNETAVDTFSLSVMLNYSPHIEAINDTTIKATIRYEYQTTASDPDNDTLQFSLGIAPSFLNIDKLSGLISGTPAPEDTGYFQVRVKVTDNKGAFDSTDYYFTVIPIEDTVIATYGKPNIDGNIFISEDDWLENWRIIEDPDDDSFWNPGNPTDNELFGIFATWDADSLYLGVDYKISDPYNTLILYSDAGLAGGVTNFNSSSGYNGEYPKNFRFRQEDAIDMFIASYYLDDPSTFLIEGNNSLNVTGETNGLRGDNAEDCEVAIAWNTIYELGAGLIPNNVELKFVAVVAGGYNYGAGDSSPNNPDVNGDAGPDSLVFLVSIFPDKDGNGIPDPTIILDVESENEKELIPSDYVLYQNYPNPFNPSTTIQFDLPAGGFVELKVFDIIGNELKTLIESDKPAGRFSLSFDASELPSGIYFYRLKVSGFTDVKKMVLLK